MIKCVLEAGTNSLKPNRSNLLGMMASTGKKQVGDVLRVGNEVFKFGPFCRSLPQGGEHPYKLDFFTHLRDGRALIHCSEHEHTCAPETYVGVTYGFVQPGLYEL